ncbi:helix-turn-helix transcriptional regulator [bacterium]|nr:helix-turn-helix transcriptional regulator [bacterium]
MDNLIPTILTTKEIQLLIASRVKKLRLNQRLKRQSLADIAGVSVSTLKHFETTGNISLKTLLLIATALGRIEEISKLFQIEEISSLKELEESCKKSPKRGRL